MNISIGIVEDNLFCQEQLANHLNNWAKKNDHDMILSVFSNSEDFLCNFHLLEDLDILFLDIQLDGMDGLALAKDLRSKNFTGNIVFLTAYKEYVFHGYQVHALNYLLKPVSYSDVLTCMNIVYEQKKVDHYTFSIGNTIYRLSYKNILYFSSDKHYIEIFTRYTSYKHLGTFKQVLSITPTYFVRCHRTLIVNTHNIESLQKSTITLVGGNTIPVSRSYIKDVRNQLLKHIL